MGQIYLEIVKILVTGLVTGLVTSIITLIVSNYIQKKNIKKEIKKDFVRKIFGYRYQINGSSVEDKEKEINFLLGQVPIIFGNNKKVIDTHLELIRDINDDTLYTFLVEMCNDKDVEIDISEWSREVIIKYLSVK